jgi:predicted GTPase
VYLFLCFRDGAEQLSVDRAMRAVSRAEIVVIVLDGSEGVTQQVWALHIINAELQEQLAGSAVSSMKDL